MRLPAHAEGVVVFNKKDLWILPLLVFCLAWNPRAQSATVFETTQLAGATVTEDAALPAPVTFEVTAAGTYTLKLTDAVTPEKLKSLRAIVTRDLTVVAQLAVDYAADDLAPAEKDFDATPGSYRIHVLGIPEDAALGGSFGVSVTPKAGGPTLKKHTDVIAPLSVPGSGQSALQATFDIAQAGTYRLKLTDLAFPEALASTPRVLLLQDSGPAIVPINADMFDATPGTYQLFIFATASPASLSGLYNVRVDSGVGTAAIYVSTQPVGNLPPATDVTIAAAGTHTLTLTDAVFPASLTGLSAVVTQNGAVLETLGTAGTKNLVAAQGPAQIYVNATPSTAEGVGAFSVQLTRSVVEVYADVVAVDASAAPESPAIFSAEYSTAVAAGPYELELEDFERPVALASMKAAMTQGATVRGLLPSEGTAQFNLQAGRLKVLVALRLPPDPTDSTKSLNGLFGLTVTAGGASAPLLETTRGVGGFFRTHPVEIQAAGPYDLTLQDLAFPDSMRDAMLIITRGTDLVAQIYGSSTVSKQQLSAGTYVLNFLGRPAEDESYGAYGLKIANSPPVPTVTFSAASNSITSGQSTTLQWTANDATACTASNGWSGAKNTTGSQSTGALSANTTYDLSCTGPGGTGNASVTVTVSPASSNRGGGGAMNPLLMGLLYLLAGLRVAHGSSRRRSCK